MNFPTPFLDLLILSASINPSGFSFSIRSIFSKKKDETINIVSLLYLGFPFLILISIIPLLKENLYFFNLPPGVFYGFAVLLVPVCIFLEYYINIFYFYFTSGRKQEYKGIALHSGWRANQTIMSLLLISFIAIGEEFIFRQCWFYILGKTFSLPVAVIVVITSACYGLNHFHYGLNTVLAKFGSGSIYGILYVVGGYSLLLPIVTHVLQNLSLILFARGKNA